MTNAFFTQHQEAIENTINNNAVSYTMNSGKSDTIAVHCYYISTKAVSISAYAIKNIKNNSVSKYVLKVAITQNSKNLKQYASCKDTSDFARHIFKTFEAKHSEQIAKTCLKTNFSNGAFRKKR